MPRIPDIIVALGSLLVFIAVGLFLQRTQLAGANPETMIDLLLVSVSGVVFLFVGLRLPTSDIASDHYLRIVAWGVGGIGLMYGFIVLRDLHPGVNAEWTIGTQAIALTIGSVGGLVIGVQKTKVRTQAQKLETSNEKLKRRERELATQNRRLDNFTGIVAHDLRSPLSATIGWIELAKKECYTESLDEATNALRRMGDVIENSLTLAKQGQSVVSFEPCNLSNLARECWETTGTRDLDLEIVDDGLISGDPDRVKQVYENLFRNASEHAGAGVTVRTGTFDTGFYVEDDGPGIPMEYRTDLFESGFTRTDDSTGFGLAIVKEIVKAHGWEVRVTDSATGGARFEISGVDFQT